MKYSLFSVIVTATLLFSSCNSSKKDTLALHADIKKNDEEVTPRNIPQEFKDYWYAGKAEITSYALTQERYGELREGTSVNIFVTEDFLPNIQVKADQYSEKNIPVLKLNHTKKYHTGIYPYSVMTSTFSPTTSIANPLKISHSMQEWCGHVYVQLNRKKDFEIMSHSYFQGEADQNFTLEPQWLENDIWNRIRINPEELPTGEFMIIPSFEYFRMSHKNPQAFSATAKLQKGDAISSYEITYTNIDRALTIYFDSEFPYAIERWQEKHANGLSTKAEKMQRINSAYWAQNSNKYEFLRDSLGLRNTP